MTQDIITVRDLAIANEYGTTLVADSTFSLGQGERLGIVGESGSGKSLTLRSIAGILPPTLQ
jgi:peptide/nickel transport system ATP-binding protein